MNIYILGSNLDYYIIKFLRGEDKNFYDLRFDGKTKHIDTWKALKIDFHKQDRDKRKLLPDSDFPSLFSNLPVLNKKSLEVLKDLLLPHGELLPLIYKDNVEYFAYNCLNLIDAFDTDNSNIEWTTVGTIIHVNKYMFYSDKLVNQNIFKVNKEILIFVSDIFVQKVLDNNLKGFHFEHVWSLDNKPLKDIKT
jgi:hypothetical protein